MRRGTCPSLEKKIEKGEVSLSAFEVRGFLVCWVMILMRGMSLVLNPKIKFIFSFMFV